MSNNRTVSVQVGPGGATLIFITLLLLKVFGYVDWSWWIITLPLWGGLALLAVIGLIVLAVAAIMDARDKRKRKKVRAEREAMREKRIAEQRNLTTRNRL